MEVTKYRSILVKDAYILSNTCVSWGKPSCLEEGTFPVGEPRGKASYTYFPSAIILLTICFYIKAKNILSIPVRLHIGLSITLCLGLYFNQWHELIIVVVCWGASTVR